MTSEDRGARRLVEADGSYAVVPLRQEKIAVGVVQTKVRGLDGDNPAPGMAENLKYLLDCIDAAQGYGGRCDLLCFHEFALQGFRPYNREQNLRVAIEAPSPELEAIAAKAKQYKCYISLGLWGKDPVNWPGHVMQWQVLLGPNGEIVDVHWKQRNVRGIFPGVEQFSTTIYDVYDKYVEMYGQDRVIPVARTDIGNIAMSAVQFEPELFRAFAMKGAEIIIRVTTGGFEFEDLRLTSYHNDCFTVHVSNCVNTGGANPGFLEETASANGRIGRSAVFEPGGKIMTEAGVFETRRRATIPIASFRQNRKIPDVHLMLYKPVYEQYVERWKPNSYADELPPTRLDAAKRLKQTSNW
jgi:predicted amidohydrolase